MTLTKPNWQPIPREEALGLLEMAQPGLGRVCLDSMECAWQMPDYGYAARQAFATQYCSSGYSYWTLQVDPTGKWWCADDWVIL